MLSTVGKKGREGKRKKERKTRQLPTLSSCIILLITNYVCVKMRSSGGKKRGGERIATFLPNLPQFLILTVYEIKNKIKKERKRGKSKGQFFLTAIN